MPNFIEKSLAEYSPLMINKLLADKTMGTNIHWVTDSHVHLGDEFAPDREITANLLTGAGSGVIMPRTEKQQEEQKSRTKKSAEVFTPSWVCCEMNNYLDEDWFGRKDVFNQFDQDQHTWTPTSNPIAFEHEGDWKKYVESRRLEITCGEAPYLVSRYDTTTGESIPLESRIGLLDRKLRVVKENTSNEKDWLKWSQRALESIYGYEYQGDNLVIARINILNTMRDYMWDVLKREPTSKELFAWINVISWNIWQMDGLTDRVPVQIKDEEGDPEYMLCRIYDWRGRYPLTFQDLKKGGVRKPQPKK